MCVRLQPEDIYAFGTQYFTELLAVREVESRGKAPVASRPSVKPGGAAEDSSKASSQQDSQVSVQQQQQQQQHSSSLRQEALDITKLSPSDLGNLVLGECF